METYFIETWGCQMNVLDSQRLEGLLQRHGLSRVERPEDADVAVLNTCSVREKAVHKVLSRLGELQGARQAGGRPAAVGLCGCVAEQEGAPFRPGNSAHRAGVRLGVMVMAERDAGGFRDPGQRVGEEIPGGP